jgi:hypothetical protein
MIMAVSMPLTHGGWRHHLLSVTALLPALLFAENLTKALPEIPCYFRYQVLGQC